MLIKPDHRFLHDNIALNGSTGASGLAELSRRNEVRPGLARTPHFFDGDLE